MNITRDDIIGLCGLDEEEVAAVAEHEHLPEVVAAALAQYLLRQARGPAAIRAMIKDDIRAALDRNDAAHAALLFGALHRFVSDHPQA